jgi:hypothetical protein
MEDLYLGGKRVGGFDNWDGRPLPPREDRTVLGDLLDELDFNRTPLSPPPFVMSLNCQSGVP